MTKSYFSRFIEWQNYIHYLLLTFGLVVFYHIIAKGTLQHTTSEGFMMFGILYLAIFVIDSVVHGLFWALPKPWRWRD